MKKSKVTDSQIISALKQAETGTPVPDLCREHGSSSATFYKWWAQGGGRPDMAHGGGPFGEKADAAMAAVRAAMAKALQ